MIKAEIVAHSINQQGDELISVLATFPRIILAEVNTHRMLSKNTSSSRAIPFNKMVKAIEESPFIPIAWQKEHSGMQGTEYFTDIKSIEENDILWERARKESVDSATYLNQNKVTKQLANRLLEPFMWTTMLITGPKSGWDNFFNLRNPDYQIIITKPEEFLDKKISFKSKKDFIKFGNNEEITKDWTELDWLKVNKGQAEIHIMDLAEKIYDAYNESTPKELKAGDWHIPFEDRLPTLKVAYTDDGLDYKEQCTLEDKVFMSVAMAARTSYTVVGEEKEINPETLIGLHDRLITQQPPHSSPMEHCNRAMTNEEYVSFIKSIHSTSNKVEHTDQGGLRQGEILVDDFIVNREEQYGWCYNIKGFIPYRYLIDNNLTL